MKTLEELIKELGLKPTRTELLCGRQGNHVLVYKDNTYETFYEKYAYTHLVSYVKEVIEVKPE